MLVLPVLGLIGLGIVCFFEGGGDHRRSLAEKRRGICILLLLNLLYLALVWLLSGFSTKMLGLGPVAWAVSLVAYRLGRWIHHKTGLPNDKGWLG